MKLLPKSLFGQMALVLAAALLVAQLVNLSFLYQSRERLKDARDEAAVIRVIAFFERDILFERILNRRVLPRHRRQRFMTVTDESLASDLPVRGHGTKVFREGLMDTKLSAETGVVVRLEKTDLRRLRGNFRSERGASTEDPLSGDRGMVLLSAQLEDGRWVNVVQPLPPDPPLRLAMLVTQALITYASVLIAGIFFTRRLSQPLARLTGAMDEVLTETRSLELMRTGPQDIQQLTEGFVAMRARVEHLFREKDVMLGALGHDLRTPLTSLRLRAEQISDDKLREGMVASIEDLSSQLETILALAKGGGKDLTHETVALQAYVNTLLMNLAKFSGHITLRSVSDGEACFATSATARVLQNIIENAVLYGQHAYITAFASADQLTFVVEDDGPGVSKDNLTQLRQPFVRGEGSRNRSTGGAGLGLAIVDQLLERMKGRADFEARPEGGLRVVVTIPVQPSK